VSHIGTAAETLSGSRVVRPRGWSSAPSWAHPGHVAKHSAEQSDAQSRHHIQRGSLIRWEARGKYRTMYRW